MHKHCIIYIYLVTIIGCNIPDLSNTPQVESPNLAERGTLFLTVNIPVASIVFSNVGGSVDSCSALGLPNGLTVGLASVNNRNTCSISGMPVQATNFSSVFEIPQLRITGTNSAGTSTVVQELSVFAQLVGRENIDDELRGTHENNRLIGLSGNDTIHALAGSDILDGGEGNDTLDGGDGEDIARYTRSGEFTLRENAPNSYSVENSHLGMDTLRNIEIISFSDMSDRVIGIISGIRVLGGRSVGNVRDTLVLSDSNDDVYTIGISLRNYEEFDIINAGGHMTEDRLVLGAGDQMYTAGSSVFESIVYNNFEVFDGGEGNDTLILSPLSDTFTVGMPFNSVTYTNFEIVSAGNGDDIITGSNGNEEIHGGDGLDQIFGEGGNDTLFGGAGDDILLSGTGINVLDGGTGSNTYFLEGEDTILLNLESTVLSPSLVQGFDSNDTIDLSTHFPNCIPDLMVNGNSLYIRVRLDSRTVVLDIQGVFRSPNGIFVGLDLSNPTNEAMILSHIRTLSTPSGTCTYIP